MSILLVYMTKCAIYSAGFYLVYTFLLSSDTWYNRNRKFILFSIFLSLILPFITIQTNRPIEVPIFGKVLSEVLVTGSGKTNGLPGSAGKVLSGLQIINLVYLAGIIFFGLKLTINFLELLFLIIRKRNKGNHIIMFHGFRNSGFSALGQIFINYRLSAEEAEEITRHEQHHLDHHHFFDIMFVEIIKVFQWFNPVIYMLDRSLRAVHEYQADEGCLKRGITVVSYQKLLLNQIFKTNIFGLTNCFSNPTLIKKRMIMMTKKRSRTVANLKLILVLPVIAFILLAFSSGRENIQADMTRNEAISIPPSGNDNSPLTSQSTNSAPAISPKFDVLPPPPPPNPTPSKAKLKTESIKGVTGIKQPSTGKELKSEPYVVVDEMPMFPGGDAALLKYISENTIYPDSAKAQNIEGRVIARFAVSTDGSVSMASILKGVNPDLDNEALRVVGSLPKFKPGKQGGRVVPVWYMVPITFTLK